MSHLEKNSLSNKDYKMVIPELFKDIKVPFTLNYKPTPGGH